MYMNQANKSLTGEVRLSYVHLAQPYANPAQPNAEPKYSVTLLIPKTPTWRGCPVIGLKAPKH